MLTHLQRKGIRRSLQQFSEAQTTLEQCLRLGRLPPEGLTKKLERITFSSDAEVQLRAVTQVREEMELQYHGQLRDMAPDNLSAYSEYMNPEEPPADWHEWLCERLMEMERREIMRMLVSAPPGHAKSTYSSRNFPSWYMGRNPKHRYIQAGHTQNFCEKEFGQRTKNLLDSERFRDIFPNVGLASDSKAAGYWALAGTGGSYLTRGVGQGIAGFRAHIAGVDDPFATREDAESQTIRDKVFDWFSADFTTRLLPNAPMFIVATRWHSDDLCGRVEQMNKDGKGLPWFIVNLPAIADDDDPLGRQPGEPLWGEFYTHEHLLNLQATLPARDWNSLYMGKPMDEVGGVVKSEWFQRYSKLPEDRFRVTVSVDSASKTNERNDYTAIGVWIEDYSRNHYLAHVHRSRMELPELITQVEAIAEAWGAGAILVEDKGSGTQYIQMRADKAPAPVIPISVNNNSKEFRFDGVAPLFQGGRVYLPDRAGWLANYEAELLGFPTAKFDDQVDMTSQYLDWARLRNGRGTVPLQGTASAGSSAAANAKRDKIAEEINRLLEEKRKAASEDPIVQALAALRALNQGRHT